MSRIIQEKEDGRCIIGAQCNQRRGLKRRLTNQYILLPLAIVSVMAANQSMACLYGYKRGQGVTGLIKVEKLINLAEKELISGIWLIT